MNIKGDEPTLNPFELWTSKQGLILINKLLWQGDGRFYQVTATATGPFYSHSFLNSPAVEW